MLNHLIILILFIYLLNLINRKIETYIGFPFYTKMHDYLKDSRLILYKKMFDPVLFNKGFYEFFSGKLPKIKNL